MWKYGDGLRLEVKNNKAIGDWINPFSAILFCEIPNGRTVTLTRNRKEGYSLQYENMHVYSITEEEVEKAFGKDQLEKVNIEHYTSSKFNLLDIVDFLIQHPDWKAEDMNGKKYIYDKQGLQQDVDRGDDSTWLVRIKPDITEELVNMTFKLIPPQPKEEWVDITIENILSMIVNDNFEETKVRIVKIDCNGIAKYKHLAKSEINMLTIKDISNYEWQHLKECK